MVCPHRTTLWHDKDNSTGGSEKATRRRRQKKRWEDNIKEKTETGFGDSLMAAEKVK